MYLNRFADTTEPLDMTETEEFRLLLASAADLGISHAPEVPYRSRNIVLRQMRFHFLEWGAPDAPPIVLLHGGHQSAHSWDLVSLHLAQRYRVLALDQRGHGDSEWARDVSYANHEMSLDAETFIGALGLERPILMGHSMGGRNAMLLTRRNPSLLRALVIVDVGPEVSDRGRSVIAGFVRDNEEFDDLEHFVRNVQQYDPYRTPRAYRADGEIQHAAAGGRQVRQQVRCEPAPARHRARQPGRRRTSRWRRRAAFDLPVLLVRGADSRILTADAAERFRDALPRGTMVTVPNCGHNVHGQNTKGFIEAVREFLTMGVG